MIEAIVEDLAVKARVFAAVDAVVAADAVLATNTSSLSVTALAARTARPVPGAGQAGQPPRRRAGPRRGAHRRDARQRGRGRAPGGLAGAADIALAMQKGVNDPRGPLAWADALGPAWVAGVIANLSAAYGEDRYRAAPAPRRERSFHEGA